MGNMKLPLSKDRSMLKGEVGWVRAWLGGAWRLEVLRQSCDQRHVSVGMGESGKRGISIFSRVSRAQLQR